jgi:hypothetical protein
MARAVEFRTGCGSSVERVWAKSASGAWFSRYRRKDPRYGWGWTRWEQSGDPPPPGVSTQEHFDYGTMPFGSDRREGGEKGLRLPW